MAALTSARTARLRFVSQLDMKMGVDECFEGGIAAVDSTGYVVPATEDDALTIIGIFAESKDNSDGSAGALSISVRLLQPRMMAYFANATSTHACTQASVGDVVYALDDQTVTLTATDHSKVGRCFEVSSTKGVLVSVGEGV